MSKKRKSTSVRLGNWHTREVWEDREVEKKRWPSGADFETEICGMLRSEVKVRIKLETDFWSR